MKKLLIFILSIAILLFGGYYIGIGFLPMGDVLLSDFSVSSSNDRLTISVFVESSVGYTRTVKNVSDNPEILKLKFYPAFGGINGKIGAQDTFDLELSPLCKEVYFLHDAEYILQLAKDESTGEWHDSNEMIDEKSN